MARQVVATDNFNRAGPGLGTNWTHLGNGAIVSSNHYETNFNNRDFLYWTNDTFDNRQYTKVTIGPSSAPADNAELQLLVRATTGGNFYYVRFIHNSSAAPELLKVTGGSYPGTSIGNFGSSNIALTDGDTASLEVEDNGSSQPVFKLFKNGSQIGSDLTDTNASPYASGSAGFGGFHAPFASFQVNDWEGGDVTDEVTGTMAVTLSNATMTAIGSVGTPPKKVSFSASNNTEIRDQFQALVNASNVGYAVYAQSSIVSLQAPVETGTFNVVNGEAEILISSAGVNVGQTVRIGIALGSDYAIPALVVVAG